MHQHIKRQLYGLELWTLRDEKNTLFINLTQLNNPYGISHKQSNITRKLDTKAPVYTKSDFITIDDCPFAEGVQSYISPRVFCNEFLSLIVLRPLQLHLSRQMLNHNTRKITTIKISQKAKQRRGRRNHQTRRRMRNNRRRLFQMIGLASRILDYNVLIVVNNI